MAKDAAIVLEHDSRHPEGLALLRLLQLASPALPIGAFAYSQALEAAVNAGLVTDEASASRWILGLLAGPVARLDLAVFARLHAAFVAHDVPLADRWSAFLLASRATSELQAEERHLGAALARVLVTLGIDVPSVAGISPGEPLLEPSLSAPLTVPVLAPVLPPVLAPVLPPVLPPFLPPPRTFAQMFALATAHWRIDPRQAGQAFAFTWAGAQSSAAVRLVPLGQSAGVRILADAARAIPAAVERSLAVADDDVGAAAPLQALLSTVHETQYSRLFRS